MKKICTKCKIEKELSEFHRHKKSKDGYTEQCKKCRNVPGVQEQRQEREKLLLLGKKKCSKCKIEKELSEFSKDKTKSIGYQPECKECNAFWYQKYKDKYHQRYRKRYLANTVEYLKQNANRKYKHRYGVTTEEKEQMIKDQDGKCLICKNDFRNTKDQCVDHDHETKRVRAILCDMCNRGLGAFRDDFELLVAASKYLLSFRQ